MKLENGYMKNLTNIMRESDTNVSDLSIITGVSRQTVHSYIAHRSSPTAEWLIQVSNHFGCSVDYLLDLTDIKNDAEYESKIREQLEIHYRELLDESLMRLISLTEETRRIFQGNGEENGQKRSVNETQNDVE